MSFFDSFEYHASFARKKLDWVKEKIEEEKPKPSGMKILNPSDDSDWKMLKYYSRINKKIKDSFKTHLRLGNGFIQLEKTVRRGQPGNVLGNQWHKLLKDRIKEKEIEEWCYENPVDLLLRQLRSRYGIKCLDSDFHLYGYMRSEDDLSPEVYLWQGDADAIGWYYNEQREQNEYVIVDWKVKGDLLNFWDSKEAYGMYLHQSLVYAKLLQLHFELNYLPSILIVPISGESGRDIYPGLFTDYPKDCKELINKRFSWYPELPGPLPRKIYGEESLFNEDILNDLKKQDQVDIPISRPLRSIFAKGATVGDLLEALGCSASSLKIIAKRNLQDD